MPVLADPVANRAGRLEADSPAVGKMADTAAGAGRPAAITAAGMAADTMERLRKTAEDCASGHRSTHRSSRRATFPAAHSSMSHRTEPTTAGVLNMCRAAP